MSIVRKFELKEFTKLEFHEKYDIKTLSKALTTSAGPLIHAVLTETEGKTAFNKQRTDMADDLMKMVVTYLKEIEEDEEGKTESVTNGILWLTSFLDSIKCHGNDSLINMPLLANMGEMSFKMKGWFGWDDELFRIVKKGNVTDKMGFRLSKMKAWIEKSKDPVMLKYYQSMTGIKLGKRSQKIMNFSVPRDRIYKSRSAYTIDEEVELFADSNLYCLNATKLASFLDNEDRYENQDEGLEWDQNSIWTEALHSFVSDPDSEDEYAEMEADSRIIVTDPEKIQPPLTRNLADRLNMLQQISGSLKCVAISIDNRPCNKNRMRNSMYCSTHRELGSTFTEEIIRQVMDPELILDKYQLIRGNWVKTPSTNPQLLSRRMKPSLDGVEWEFTSQMKVMEHLLRKLFNAGMRRTAQDRQMDLIPEKELIEEFGKLQFTTYSQVYRATREKIALLGFDVNVRWTKYAPYLRLLLGAHFGFMDPKEAMGRDEVDFLSSNWLATDSVWSGTMDETRYWNKGSQGPNIPVLNHKFNYKGLVTPIVNRNGHMKADMDATPTFS